VDWEKTYQQTKELLDDLGIAINPKASVSSLTVSQMQMVEIAKAMSINPCVLQLDEPTSALSQAETMQLFRIMLRLKEKGVVVIFVTHRLQELWNVADTCTVLRDGQFIGKVSLKNASRQDVLQMMFGSVEILTRPADIVASGEAVLEVKNLSRAGKFRDISFTLRKGEILGIAGMLGSGRTELLRSIWGADRFESGEVYCKGIKVVKHTPMEMKRLGLGMVQEDRKRDGIIAYDTILSNATFAGIQEIGKGMFFDSKLQHRLYEKQREALNIKAPSADTVMAALSGGNQQKVILARMLNTSPEVLLFDEPSRGIDVATKQQIFKIIWELSRQGISSIIVSSELEELLEVCTRLIVMRNGEFVKQLQPEGLTADKLYLECMGE
jgi:ribose transport system ATP-binding protein